MITRRSPKSCSPVCRQNTVSRCNGTTKTMSNIAYHQTPIKDVDDVDDDGKSNDPSSEDILAPKALFQEQHESSLTAFLSTCIVASVVGGSTLLGSLFGGIWLSLFLCSASTGCMATISAQHPRAIEAKFGTYVCMSQRYNGGNNMTSIVDQYLPRRSRSLIMERGSNETSRRLKTVNTSMKTTTTSSDRTVWLTVDSNLPRNIENPSNSTPKSKVGTESSDDGTVWLTVDSNSPRRNVTTPTISNAPKSKGGTTSISRSAPTMISAVARTTSSHRLSLQSQKVTNKIHADCCSTTPSKKKQTKNANIWMPLPPPMYSTTTTSINNTITKEPDMIWCQPCNNTKAGPTASTEITSATRTTTTSRRLYLQLEKARRNKKIRDAFTKKKHTKHVNITMPLPPPITAAGLLNNDKSGSTRQQSDMMMLWCQPCSNPKSGPNTSTSTTLMSATTTTSTLTRSTSSKFITTTAAAAASRRVSLQLEKARRNKIRADSSDSTAALKKKKTTSKKTTNSTSRIPLPPPMLLRTWINKVATNNVNASNKHKQEQHGVQGMWCQPCNKELWCLPCTPTLPPALTTVGTF